jgi:S1-C subfamily serine protease
VGELIGINTAVRSETEGIGYAIPVEQVRSFLEAVDAGVAPPFIGAGFTTLDAELLGQADPPIGAAVGVSGVNPFGPAASADLRTDDVITDVDGTPVATATDMATAMAAKSPGDSVRFSIVRQQSGPDEQLDIEVILAEAVVQLPEPSA